jgi:polygalacturonase
MKHWPRFPGKNVLHCMEFVNSTGLTITSSGTGTLEGNGATWWGFPGIGYLEHTENRPRLLQIVGANDTMIENIYFHNSPYWTFNGDKIDGLEIRNC